MPIVFHHQYGKFKKRPPVDTTPPAPPTGFLVTGSTDSTISLAWTASVDSSAGDFRGYVILRATSSGGLYDRVGTSLHPSATFVDTGRTYATTYWYKALAFDASNNESALTTAVAGTTTADVTAPTIPTNLLAFGPQANSIQLSWTASSDPLGSGVSTYTVYRSPTEFGSYVSVDFVVAPTVSYTDFGLTPSTTYWYKVSATDVAGNVSGQSGAATETTAASAQIEWNIPDLLGVDLVLTPDAPSAGYNYQLIGYVSVPEGETPTFSITEQAKNGVVGSYGITVGQNNGVLTVPAGLTADSYDVTVDLRAATVSRIDFARIPEIVFLDSYAENENLGIWQIDPTNRWPAGDLYGGAHPTWTIKPEAQSSLVRTAGSALAGVTYNSATGVLSYSGARVSGWAKYKLVSALGSESNEFIVRVLQPKVVWGNGTAARESEFKAKWPTCRVYDRYVDTADYTHKPITQTIAGTPWYQATSTTALGSGSQDPNAPDICLVVGSGVALEAEHESGPSGLLPASTPATKTFFRRSSTDRPYHYVIGEPGARPHVRGQYSANGTEFQYGGSYAASPDAPYINYYVKNMEFEDVMVKGAGWIQGKETNVHYCGCYFHDTYSHNGGSRGDTIGFSAGEGPTWGSDADDDGGALDEELAGAGATLTSPSRFYVWRCQFLNNGGGDQKHHLYTHGRHFGFVYYNCNKANGGWSCSTVKTTSSHAWVANSWISALGDDSNPLRGAMTVDGHPDYAYSKISQQLIDFPAASNGIVYNNFLRGAFRVIGAGETQGTRLAGSLWLNGRLSLAAGDAPRYPSALFATSTNSWAEYRSHKLTYTGISTGGTATNVRAVRLNPTTFAEVEDYWGGAGAVALIGSAWYITLRENMFPTSGPYVFNLKADNDTGTKRWTLNAYRDSTFCAVTPFINTPGLGRPNYDSDPQSFVPGAGDSWWTAMNSWSGGAYGSGRSDPSNPYTWKKFLAHNNFDFYPGSRDASSGAPYPFMARADYRVEAVKDESTLPAFGAFTDYSCGAVPETWASNSVTFTANNTYQNYENRERVLDMEQPLWNAAKHSFYGPWGGTPGANGLTPEKIADHYPARNQPLAVEKTSVAVRVGGEKEYLQSGNYEDAEIPIPSWFKLVQDDV